MSSGMKKTSDQNGISEASSNRSRLLIKQNIAEEIKSPWVAKGGVAKTSFCLACHALILNCFFKKCMYISHIFSQIRIHQVSYQNYFLLWVGMGEEEDCWGNYRGQTSHAELQRCAAPLLAALRRFDLRTWARYYSFELGPTRAQGPASAAMQQRVERSKLQIDVQLWLPHSSNSYAGWTPPLPPPQPCRRAQLGTQLTG